MQQTVTVPGSRASWRPPLVDALVAAGFVVLCVAEALFSPTVRSPLLHATVAGLAMAALAWRRRFPVGVAAVVIAADLAVNPSGQFSTVLALVLVAFTIGSETERPRSYAGLALLVVPFVGVMTAQGLEPSDVAAAFVFIVGPWAVGLAVRQRTERAEEALARAERLEQAREREAAEAAAAERTRIARELHDIVSHSISVVTIQTQAVRRRLGPDHAREAADLAAVEATAREALAEMRRLFGVLRAGDESPALAPQPGLGELERLVAGLDGSGIDVRLRVEGRPVELSPGVDLAAYRIVQEGLTNAVRHSGARQATVVVRYLPKRLEVTVEDDGRGLGGAGAHPGGHGLVGIRERIALYDGSLELADRVGGGLRLHATLPVGATA